MYSMALDNSWIVMNEEEMYDVNGGAGLKVYYLSHQDLGGLVGAAFLSGIVSYTYAYCQVSAIAATLACIPVVGPALAVWLIGHSVAFAWAIVDVAFTGKGIQIYANTFWGIPNGTFSFDVC